MNQEKIQFTNTSPLKLPREENGQPVTVVDAKKIRIDYCLYARKSSEDDERQALSIDSQIKEMAIQAQEQELRVLDIRKESHSAKESGQRPIFEELIADIRKGKFTGILSWAPDRLSRNAGDLGTLVDLMDNGQLIEIRTHGQIFTNSPNDKFLLMILCSQAKLENDNRGINVKRGMKAKCEIGFRPNMAPLGYLNDHYSGKGQKKVFIDKERAPIIKEMFEKVAFKGYSGRKIFNWLRGDIDFRTKSGKLVTLSSIYRMLNNPYYCGIFEFPVGSGKWYKGSYEPIISKDLFDKVQKKMEVPPKSKPGTKQFNFTKILKCGNCGSGITAQESHKRFKNGNIKHYVYYHCTQFRNFNCKEPYIREEQLVEEFIRILDGVDIKKIEQKKKLNEELARFQRFNSIILGKESVPTKEIEKINIQKFIRYIFQEGTRGEKRELITCLDKELCIKDRKIITE